MTRTKDTEILTVLHPVCCGLDVHKDSIASSLIVTDVQGHDTWVQETFQTFTDDLMRLKEWLLDHECPVVSMESTGVYWHPVHNVLEGHIKVVLVNARNMKNLPGRKTDMSDSQWIASLLRVGLLKGCFIPERAVRDWRDLARYRKDLVNALGDSKRHAHKLFQSSNIKIDSVVSDLFGKTGRNLMNLLLKTTTELTLEDVKNCLRGKLKSKGEELYRAVQGFFDDHRRWMLKEILDRIEYHENLIRKVEARLQNLLEPHDDLIKRLMEIPGVSHVAASAIVSEIGTTLETFPNAEALSSWSGVCPGNNESVGTRHNARSPVRGHNLRTTAVEIAWAAVKAKGTYYRDKYFSLRARKGPKKAIMAIAHKIVKAVFHVIKHGVRYQELGEDYLLERRKESILNFIKRQAEKLGFKIIPEFLYNRWIHHEEPLAT